VEGLDVGCGAEVGADVGWGAGVGSGVGSDVAVGSGVGSGVGSMVCEGVSLTIGPRVGDSDASGVETSVTSVPQAVASVTIARHNARQPNVAFPNAIRCLISCQLLIGLKG
jgi:hypothetical protein